MTNGTRNTFDAKRRWSAFVASNAQHWVQGSLLVTLLATTAGAVPFAPSSQTTPTPRPLANVGFVQGTPLALSQAPVSGTPFVPHEFANPIEVRRAPVGFVQGMPDTLRPVTPTVTSVGGVVTGGWLGGVWA